MTKQTPKRGVYSRRAAAAKETTKRADEPKRAVALAIEAAGGQTALARKLVAIGASVSSQAINQWDQIPAGRVIAVEQVTGLHRSVLRPDLYPDEKARQRA